MTLMGEKIVDKTIMEADKDRDGKISFEEFTKMVENTDVSMSMTLGTRNLPRAPVVLQSVYLISKQYADPCFADQF